jgi:hypothetical protein
MILNKEEVKELMLRIEKIYFNILMKEFNILLILSNCYLSNK